MSVWKIIGAVLGVFLLGQPLEAQTSYRTPFSAALEAQVAQQPGMQQNPGMSRLRLLRFYQPTNEVYQKPGLLRYWLGGKERTREQETAVALYLFNMYISTAAYREDMPQRLTLDYLGALDGFSKCDEMFDLKKMGDFYTRHRAAIQAQLADYFKRGRLPEYEIYSVENEKRERGFLQLLATGPSKGNWPGYVWTGATRLSSAAYRADKEKVGQMLQQSLTEGANKVVTYTVPQMQWENLDNPLATPKHGVDRLYRCVNDECAYCSYWLGKNFCEQLAVSREGWKWVRLYKITAYPTAGEFLYPAQGDRFALASGEKSSPWFYHTAILVVMNVNGRHVPLVADKFLAGEEPVLLEKWLQNFRTEKTYFTVEVFERNQTMEDAISEPSARRGEDVIVDGQVYRPYQVLP